MDPICRPTLLLVLALAAATSTSAATLAPSADPVTTFIVVADSVARTDGDAALSAIVRDNPLLVGAAVANLLDVAFQASADNPTAAAENVAFAKRVAAAYGANGGPAVVSSLVDTYQKWTPSQRTTRARAVDLENQASAARKSGDIDKAVALLGQARALYEKIGDRHSVAVNWGTMGVAHWGTGDWDVVLADYQNALTARRDVDDHILEGRTLNGMGSAYQQKADYDQAIEFYTQAIDLRRRTGDLSGLGTSITYLGHVYNKVGRYVDARDRYEEALPILESLGNPQQMVELLSGIALLNHQMGRTEDADAAYRRAIDLAAANGLGANEALCRRNLANAYRQETRFTEALAEIEAAMALLDKNPDPTENALCYQTRGLTYVNMGETDAARDDLVKFSELAKGLDNPVWAITAQLNIGDLYRELGAYDRGLKAADQARALAETAADGRSYRDAMALKGDLNTNMGRYSDAMASWHEALAQDQADGAEALVLVDEVSIASIKAAMGQADSARVDLRALAPRVKAAHDSQLDFAVLLAIGHSFEKENADSAAHYYEAAIDRIEATGAEIGGAAIQTGYLSGERRFYYEEVTRFYADEFAATHDLAWSARAFHTIERAKARGLLEMLQARVAGQMSPEESKVLDELYGLDPKQPGYTDQRTALESRFSAMRRARVQSVVGGLAPVSIAQLDVVARHLPGKAVMLEYALGDSASFVWIVDRKSSTLVKLPPRRVIDPEVRRMRDAMSHVGAGDSVLLKSLRSLYDMLVAPAAAALSKADLAIVVPDGTLFELPFEALLTAAPSSDAGWAKQPFLARQVATLYAPSATVYLSEKEATRHEDYALDLFAAGNPDFSTLATGGGPALQPLPYANAEVDAIGATVKQSRRLVVTGRDATEAIVKKELRSGSPRVVHLATHGLVDPVEPTRSSVALTASDHEDGYFHTLEILDTPTHAGLVVMSACESAGGKLSRGEGVVGLNRAFLAAGAQAVVASLWSVSDESTADLMKTFYDRMLGKKKSASEALNDARLAMIKGGKFAHPFYWSPFIVTGTEQSPW
jgi:CHAT domain-containing protein/tetratricopeptide (TPR) repeat protein